MGKGCAVLSLTDLLPVGYEAGVHNVFGFTPPSKTFGTVLAGHGRLFDADGRVWRQTDPGSPDGFSLVLDGSQLQVRANANAVDLLAPVPDAHVRAVGPWLTDQLEWCSGVFTELLAAAGKPLTGFALSRRWVVLGESAHTSVRQLLLTPGVSRGAWASTDDFDIRLTWSGHAVASFPCLLDLRATGGCDLVPDESLLVQPGIELKVWTTSGRADRPDERHCNQFNSGDVRDFFRAAPAVLDKRLQALLNSGGSP